LAIKGVYVIKDNGSALFHRTYDESAASPDGDLVSGFISAIFSFSKEFGRDQITKMETKLHKFFYHLYDKLIFVIITELEMDKNDSVIVKLLERMAEIFVHRYAGRISEEIDRSKFSDFQTIVDQLIEEYNKNQSSESMSTENQEKYERNFEKECSVSSTHTETNCKREKPKQHKNQGNNDDSTSRHKTRDLFLAKPFSTLRILAQRFTALKKHGDDGNTVVEPQEA